MYYIAYEIDTKKEFETGKNSKTEKDCVDSVFELIFGEDEFYPDIKNEDVEYKKPLLQVANIDIDGHEELIK